MIKKLRYCIKSEAFLDEILISGQYWNKNNVLRGKRGWFFFNYS